EHRADAWVVDGPGAEGVHGITAVLAGQDEVRGRTMRVAHLVMGRPDDCGVVCLPSHARQVLANLNAGYGRADRLELAAELDRQMGLHVPHVWLRRPPGQIEHNTGLRTAASFAPPRTLLGRQASLRVLGAQECWNT